MGQIIIFKRNDGISPAAAEEKKNEEMAAKFTKKIGTMLSVGVVAAAAAVFTDGSKAGMITNIVCMAAFAVTAIDAGIMALRMAFS